MPSLNPPSFNSDTTLFFLNLFLMKAMTFLGVMFVGGLVAQFAARELLRLWGGWVSA